MAGTVTAPGGEATSDDPLARGLSAVPEASGHSAVSDAAFYTVAVYGAQVMLLVGGLAQKGLLGPKGTGYWALMQTAWTFFSLAALGTFDGAGRQIPTHRGREDYAAAAGVADTASSFSILAMCVAGTAVAGVAAVFGSGWPGEIRYGLIALGLIAPLRFFGDCHEVILQATKRFRVVSAGKVVTGVVALTLQTAFVYLFGFYGMFMGVVANTLGILILWNRMGMTSWRRPAFRWRIERRWISELMSFGLPIMIFAQIWLLFLAIDSLIVAKFISVESLGYYSLAVSVATYGLLLPKSITAVLGPRMSERFGRTQDAASIRHYATDTQRLLAYMLVPVFTGVAFFLLPVVIRQALPEFEPAIPVVHIMVAASFFIALVSMPLKLLITAGYRLVLTLLMVACVVVNAACNYVAVAVLDLGVEGAAFATALSYFVLFVTLTTYSLSKVLRLRQALLHVAELLVVFGYVTAELWGIETLLGAGAAGFGEDLLFGLAKLAMFVILLSPWLLLAQRRFGALMTIWSLLKAVRPAVREDADVRR